MDNDHITVGLWGGCNSEGSYKEFNHYLNLKAGGWGFARADKDHARGCGGPPRLCLACTPQHIRQDCGAQHDRDLNASLNIKQEGIRMLKAAGLTVLRS